MAESDNNRGSTSNIEHLSLIQLSAIEVVELGQIKVMAIKGRSIFDAGKECIALAKFLKVAVKLYFNNKQIDIYVDTTLEQIIAKI
jgi:hypothetical protein